MRRVVVIGRGKVGSALARAARRARVRVASVSARALPAAFGPADLVVVASRDADIGRLASLLAARLAPDVPVVHCSGALGPDALAPLRASNHPVGSMHPLASFASSRAAPPLAGAAMVITGDAAARRAAARFGRVIGMRPVVLASLDPARYHAAAALLSNGSAALAAAASELLGAAGVPAEHHARLLGPLLGSVASNVGSLGTGAALTGPIRRGDAATVARPLEVLSDTPLRSLYKEIARAQLPLAARLGDADPAALGAIDALLEAP